MISSGAAPSSEAPGDIAAKVDAYMNAAQKLKWFSGSVLLAKGGKVLVSKGYGMADYELDVPNTPQTKFRLGSVTKQFTAMAVMELQEKGLLRVEDPVKKFLPDYPNGDKITIRHLLTHTSGIPNFTDFPDYVTTMTLPSPHLKRLSRDSRTSPWNLPRGKSSSTATPATSSWAILSKRSRENPMRLSSRKTSSPG